MTVLQEIESKALLLSPDEKGRLIHDLLIAMDGEPPYSGDFEKEIQRRVCHIKSGNAVGTPAAQVFCCVERTSRLLHRSRKSFSASAEHDTPIRKLAFPGRRRPVSGLELGSNNVQAEDPWPSVRRA